MTDTGALKLFYDQAATKPYDGRIHVEEGETVATLYVRNMTDQAPYEQLLLAKNITLEPTADIDGIRLLDMPSQLKPGEVGAVNFSVKFMDLETKFRLRAEFFKAQQ